MPNAAPERNKHNNPPASTCRGNRRSTERSIKKFFTFAIFNKKASIPQFPALFA
jgi:hypothetical protein